MIKNGKNEGKIKRKEGKECITVKKQENKN